MSDNHSQSENPYVREALEAINASILWGGWFDLHNEQLIAILERLAEDSYNEGLAAERRPS